MRIRRTLVAFLILAGVTAVAWEAWRATLAVFLWRGNCALLERWGGDAYFVRAVQRFGTLPPDAESVDDLVHWARHRYGGRFPDEAIQSIQALPSGELALLLRDTRTPLESQAPVPEQFRIVVLDPARSGALVASSDVLKLNGWEMEWQGDWVLVHGGRQEVDIALVLRREGSGFRFVPRETYHAPPYFFAGGHVRFVADGQGDSPRVECDAGRFAGCDGCGKAIGFSVEIWTLIDGSYRRRGVRHAACAACGELARTN